MAWCPVVIEPPSVLRVRADCGSRLVTANLGVVVYYLSHQPLEIASERGWPSHRTPRASLACDVASAAPNAAKI